MANTPQAQESHVHVWQLGELPHILYGTLQRQRPITMFELFWLTYFYNCIQLMY